MVFNDQSSSAEGQPPAAAPTRKVRRELLQAGREVMTITTKFTVVVSTSELGRHTSLAPHQNLAMQFSA
jgi:hypothetical protein